MPVWTAYHNKSIASHVLSIVSLSNSGFRPQAIALHGQMLFDSAVEPVASAIWVQRPGPDFKILPLGHKGELEAFIDEWKKPPKGQPYWPRLIAACGGNYSRFSLVVEQGGPESYVETGVFGYEIGYRFDVARKVGEFPLAVSVYNGSVLSAETYECAFIWQKQASDRWIYFNAFHVDEADVATVDGAMTAGFSRADYAGVYPHITQFSPNITTRRYFMMYRNDVIPGTVVESNIAESAVTSTINTQGALGKWPIRIHANGLPGLNQAYEQRFAIVFADYPHDREPDRVLTISRPTYPANAPPTPWAQFAPLEQAFIDSLKKCSVQAGQVAVAFKGRLVYTAGFTWAPQNQGYPITKPTTRFAVGSMSKPICALAFCRLWDQDSSKLNPSMTIEPLLGRTFKDTRLKTRTCAQLMSHLGRFDNAVLTSWEADEGPFNLAAELGVSLPLRLANIVDWVAKDLDNCFTDDDAPKPGTSPLPVGNYDGAGFTMLSEICARRYQQVYGFNYDYEKGVLDDLFKRVGVTRPRKRRNVIAGIPQNDETSAEVRYHAAIPTYGFSQQASNAHAITPIAYDPGNSDVYMGNGAWAMACADYARVLSAFDLSPNPLFDNPLVPGEVLTEEAMGWYRGFARATYFFDAGGQQVDAMWHNGALAGGEAVGFRRFDGVTIVYAYNTDLAAYSGIPKLFDVTANQKVNLVVAWPTFDLFPNVL